MIIIWIDASGEEICVCSMTHLLYTSWLRHHMETFSALLGLWGILRSPVNSPHKGQWRGALVFCFNSAWTNSCANNRDAGDLRRHRAHHDVTVMLKGGDTTTEICVFPAQTKLPKNVQILPVLTCIWLKYDCCVWIQISQKFDLKSTTDN